MGVTITVLMALGIGVISLPFTIVGIIFLILYFLTRNKMKKSKALLILPVISVCIGELLTTPIGALVILVTSQFEYYWIMAVVSAVVFVAGIVMLILCAVKTNRGEKVKGKSLLMSLVMFLLVLCRAHHMDCYLFCYL